MAYLIVGDPHVTPDSLEECGKLIDFIIEKVKEHKVDTVIFLGDLYHNHGVVHLSVLAFWQDAFDKIDSSFDGRIVALVGNHDKSGDVSAQEHALMLHKNVEVVGEPIVFEASDVLFVPFMADRNLFVEACKKYPDIRYVVAHQEFVGGLYDNGYGISAMAIDPNSIPQEKIISGHIHTAQKFGKVWYPGSPRWKTLHDANIDKFIYVVDRKFEVLEAIPTDKICKKIVCLRDSEESPATFDPSFTVTVDVYGSKEYVDARKKVLETLGCKVRTFPTIEKKVKVKESDGISIALMKFLKDFPTNYDKQSLIKMCRERISWMK